MEQRVRLRAGVVFALVLISLAIVFFKGKVSTDLSVFLPDATNQKEELLLRQLGNGVSSNLLFISLSGLDKQELAAKNREFAKKLEETGLFKRVVNQTQKLEQSQIDFLLSHRYQLSDAGLKERFTEAGLREQLEKRVQGLVSSTASLEKKFLRNDPTGEVIRLLFSWQDKLSSHNKPAQVDGIWFSPDYERTLLYAEVAGTSGFELEQQELAVNSMRQVFEQIQQNDLKMVAAGPAVFAVEIAENIKRDIRVLTYAGLSLVILFLLLVYRSPQIVLYIVTPLLTGVIVATALILLIYGEIHGITLAFGITLAGVAVDYPIHILTGIEPNREASREHIKKIWRTLRLGVVSTVVAYGAFIVSGFGGLKQLGLFTVTGLIVAAYFSRWVLPAIVQRFYLEASGLNRLHEWLKDVGQILPKYKMLVVVAFFAAISYLTFTSSQVVRLDVDSLSPISDARKAQGRDLRSDLGFWFGGHMLVVLADSKDDVLAKSEHYSGQLDTLLDAGAFSGYDMAAHFIPSEQVQGQNLQVLNDSAAIEEKLKRALASSRFKESTFAPFISDLKKLQNSKPLNIEDLLASPLGRPLNALLFDYKQQQAGIILLHEVNAKRVNMLKQLDAQNDDIVYIHMKSAATDLVEHSMVTTAWSMLVAVFILYLVLTVAFKDFSRPLKIMVPTFSAALVVAAMLVFMGHAMSVFHFISLLLVIGLGLDYALFFNRLPGNNHEWNTTFKALWICGVTTILVFGVLTLSTTPPLKAIGTTVALGAFVSMLFASMWAARPQKPKRQKRPRTKSQVKYG